MNCVLSPNMPLIGLTGLSGSGKNVAASILQNHGCVIIDADEITHQVLKEVESQIIERWDDRAKNKAIELVQNGVLNRQELAQLLFSNQNFLVEHEAMILPLIEAEIQRKIDIANTSNCVKSNIPIILNAPTLHKTGFVGLCRLIIFIDSPFIVRLLRIKKRDKISLRLIFKRFFAQRDFFAQYTKKNADIVTVMNCGTVQRLEKRLKDLLRVKGFEV